MTKTKSKPAPAATPPEAAKASTAPEAAKPEPVKPTAEQIKLAVISVCAITGCGRIDAESRVAKMAGSKLCKLAELEASGRRKEAVQILYR